MAEKEYIEREAVINHIDCVVNEAPNADYRKAAWGFGVFVSRLPAADVAPVKHGNWNVTWYRYDNYASGHDYEFCGGECHVMC